MQPDVVGLLVLAVCVVLFVTKALPSPVVGTMGCLLMVLFGAATFEEAFSGFSSSIVLLMASAMIVGIAMFKTGTAQVIGRCIIRWARGSESIFLFSTCLTAGVMAMFLANTAVLAAFIPIVDSVCKTSDKIRQRTIVLPLAYAVMFGGSCTLIGCTPQLTANGLLSQMAGIQMGMWTLTGPGLCLFGAFLLYTMLVGRFRGDRIWGHREEVDMNIDDAVLHSVLTQAHDRRKIVTMLIIVALMMISYILELIPVASTAILAALMCLILGLCTVKDVQQELHWDTIVFLASCLGLANALTAASSGDLIGRMVTACMGGLTSPFPIYGVLVLLTLVISQVITNSTAIIMVLPIALSLCSSLGFAPMGFCIGITLAASIACCTPLAAAQIAMTEVAGYHFSDYLRYGLPITVIGYLVILVTVPLVYPLV